MLLYRSVSTLIVVQFAIISLSWTKSKIRSFLVIYFSSSINAQIRNVMDYS